MMCDSVTCDHVERSGERLLGEMSKFPFCDHKQTTKDDKRR